tara:strand:- start:570 stop:827 length:258 start_codon:yes stop_codon:yes gene_type:complete
MTQKIMSPTGTLAKAKPVYQHAVLAELEELEGKAERLLSFMNTNPKYLELCHEEQGVLRRQLTAMKNLASILGERIEIWKAADDA